MLKRALSGLFFCLPLTLHAGEQSPVHEYLLKNGLKVLIREDHRAPVAVSQVWYKVGSSYEHDGSTGLSHALEHMMFKGTKSHRAGEFSRIISKNGGRENAFTGRDYTAYFQQLAKNRLKVSFSLEADRMRNLLLAERDFKKEIRVVMEERRLRTEDDPQELTVEQFYATAFFNNPYRHPVIGWMSDLENMRAADLRAWYTRWYAPNNATLVVVGDVNPAAVYNLARKYFGRLRSSTLPHIKARLEPQQKGVRRITVKAPAELPYLLMGYKVPVLRTAAHEWEPYALEVLAAILDGGKSARLAREVVRGAQIAASADAGYNIYTRYSDLLTLDGTPAQGHDIAELEAALRAQVRHLREQPVTRDELERVKTQVVADRIYARDSLFFQAMQMGILETVGLGWRRLDEYVDKIRSITAQQVQDVARRYLVNDNLTVAVLKPLPIKNEK